MILFECMIPDRAPIKKNTAKHFRFGVVYSKQFLKWEKIAIKFVEQKAKATKHKTIEEYCEGKFNFYFANHQWEPDCSNIVEGIQDVLEKCKVLKNDKLLKKITVEKHFGEKPRLEFEILKLDCNSESNAA